MTKISGNVPATSEDFRQISEDFRSLPKIKCPLTVPEDVWALSKLLKTTLLACLDIDCLWRRSLPSNLEGTDPEKLYRATLRVGISSEYHYGRYKRPGFFSEKATGAGGGGGARNQLFCGR